jgi:hypothetical protein
VQRSNGTTPAGDPDVEAETPVTESETDPREGVTGD